MGLTEGGALYLTNNIDKLAWEYYVCEDEVWFMYKILVAEL